MTDLISLFLISVVAAAVMMMAMTAGAMEIPVTVVDKGEWPSERLVLSKVLFTIHFYC